MGYHVYVTDTLRCIAQNTSAAFGGRAPAVRWADTLRPEDSGADAAALACERLRRAGIGVTEHGPV